MKKITLLNLLLVISFSLFSQNTVVKYYKWSDPETFKLSPAPTITGYGYYSDSLSKMYDGKTFYEYNNEYYCIESWADYYYWFTQAYRHMFADPQLYEYYYWGNDDYGMVSYIASNKYLGKYYPSSLQWEFGDKQVQVNRLSNSEYTIDNDSKKNEILKKQLDENREKIERPEKGIDNTKSPEIFKRDHFRKEKLENNPYSNKQEESQPSNTRKESTKSIK